MKSTFTSTTRVVLKLLVLKLLMVGCLYAQESNLHLADEIIPNTRLVDIAQDTLEFSIAGKPTTVPIAKLARWGYYPGITRNSAVWLSDGSWICGDIVIQADEQAAISSSWWQPILVPLREIRAIVLQPPASLGQASALKAQLSNTDASRDTVWLISGRQASGILRWGDPTNDNKQIMDLRLESGQSSSKLELSDVKQIVFSSALFPPLDPTPKSLQMGTADGSLLHVQNIQRDGARVRITTTGGIALVSLDSHSEFCRSLRYLENHLAEIKILSRIEAANYRFVAQNSLEWPVGKDVDLFDRPLMTKQGMVGTGLAMHSTSQLAYRWDGSAGILLAEVVMALPEEGADESLGSVECQVIVARNGKLDVAHQFPLRRGNTTAHQLQLNLSGAQLFALVVNEADKGQYGDHVLWLNARIAQPK